MSFTIAEELTLYNGGNGIQVPFLEGPIGVSSSSGRYPRRLPPSFAQASNGKLFAAFGDQCVKVWDGLATSFHCAGVPAPTTKPSLASGGEGRIIGERFAYTRFLDADGRVSSLSPLSDPLNVWGSAHTITAATNAAPIVITSASHGLTTAEQVHIDGIQGNTAANGDWTVTAIDSNTFSLDGSVGNGDFLGVDSGRVSVTTLRDGAAAVNEVQTITASGTPSGGTWTITFNGSTTSALAYDANAATVQTALRLLPSIGGANVTVSGGALGTAAFTLTFSGTLAGTNVPQVTVDDSSLSGAAITVSIVTLTDGNPGTNEVQTLQLYGATGGTCTLTFSGQTTAAIAYNANAATIQTALENLSNLAPGDVSLTNGPWPALVTVTFGGAYANTNVPQITINPASLTGVPSASVSTVTGGVSSLATNNVHYWKLNESSGTRYASVGSVDLTEDGSVSSSGGILGNAALFNSGVVSLLNGSSTSTFSPDPATSYQYAVAFWLYANSAPSSFHNLVKSGVHGWSFSLNGALKVEFTVYDRSQSTNATVTYGSAITTGTWHLVVGVIDPANNRIRLSLDNAAFTDVSLTDPGYATTTGLVMGDNFIPGNFDGRIDELGLWQRTLTTTDLSSLYNSGSGTTTPFSGGTNEVQRISEANTPAAGSFTLSFTQGGSTIVSAAIAYNASSSTVQSTLEAMSNIGSGNVSCSGGPLPGSNIDVTFQNSLGSLDVSQMVPDSTLLKCNYATTTSGSPTQSEVQRVSASPTPIAGTFTLTFSGQTTSALAYTCTAAQMKTALDALSNIGGVGGSVTCSGGPINLAPINVTFGGTLANTNVAQMTATSSLTGVTVTVTPATTTEGSPAVNERQQVFVAGTITGGTYTLTYSGQTTAALSYLSTAADVQAALIALSNIGASDVSCSVGPLPTAITVDFQGTLAGSNLSEMTATNTTVGGGWARGAQYLVYSNVEAPTDRRVVSRQVLRNKLGSATTFYVDVDSTDLTSTSFTSYKTDEELVTAVPLQDSNGFDLNVVRHGEPPNQKRAIASFLNRLFMAVNHVNTLGELTATDASTSIVGQDAFFRTVFDNRTIFPQGTNNTQAYLIDSLNVPTQTVTSTDTYDGSTLNGIHYGLETAPPDDLTLYYSELDDAESWNPLNGLTIERIAADGKMTGLFPLVTSMLVLFENRSSKLTFRASPLLSSSPETGGDGRIIPASYRGCVNNRCAVKAGDVAYLLDYQGCYLYDDSAVTDISDPIALMFQPGHEWSIYWPAKESFHAVYDQELATVKWFVVIGDGQYPRHAICYHVDRKRLWLEKYPWPITSSCTGRLGQRVVTFYGSTARRLFVASGSLDSVDVQANNRATLRGVVTSARQFTLTDSTASFPSSLANVPVSIVNGKGSRQQNIVISNTSTTLTLLNPWVIAPDTTSTYQIGSIDWRWTSSMMKLTTKGSEELRGVQVTYTPTTRDSTIILRTYGDFSATADVFATDYDSDGTTTTKDSDEVQLDLTHSTGFVEIASDSFYAGRGTHRRYLTVELNGTTNGETQQISEVSVIGVES